MTSHVGSSPTIQTLSTLVTKYHENTSESGRSRQSNLFNYDETDVLKVYKTKAQLAEGLKTYNRLARDLKIQLRAKENLISIMTAEHNKTKRQVSILRDVVRALSQGMHNLIEATDTK